MDAEAIRNRLARLHELDEAAAQQVRDAWPSTLSVLDEPDGTIVEIPIGATTLTPGGPIVVGPGRARYDIATLRRQLGEHLDEELDRLDPERPAA